MIDLRVIEGSGMCRKRERHELSGKGDIILPPVKLSYDAMCHAMGMTRHQVNRAFHLACAIANEDRSQTFRDYTDAQRELEIALDAYRQVLLAALMTEFPKLTRRIMKGVMTRRLSTSGPVGS
jgi:hypothetical protein